MNALKKMKSLRIIGESLRTIITAILLVSIFLFSRNLRAESGMIAPVSKTQTISKNFLILDDKNFSENFLPLNHLEAKDKLGKISFSFEFEYEPYESDGKLNLDKSALILDKKFYNDYLEFKNTQNVGYKISDSAKIGLKYSKNYIGASNSKEIDSIKKSELSTNLTLSESKSNIFDFSINASKLSQSTDQKDFASFEKTYRYASFATRYEKNLSGNLQLALRLGSSFASLSQIDAKKYSVEYGFSLNKEFENSKLRLSYNHGFINETSLLSLYQVCLEDKASAGYEHSLFKNLRLSLECGFIKTSNFFDENMSNKTQKILIASSGLQLIFSKNIYSEVKYTYTNDRNDNPVSRAASSTSFNLSYYFF